MCLWEFSQREDSHLNLEKKKGSCIVSLMNWMTGLFHLTYGHEAVKTVCLTSGTSLQSQRQQKGNWLWRREQIVEAAAGWGRASCSVIKASEHDPVPGNTPANLQTSFKEQSRPKILRRSTGLGKKQKKQTEQKGEFIDICVVFSLLDLEDHWLPNLHFPFYRPEKTSCQHKFL